VTHPRIAHVTSVGTVSLSAPSKMPCYGWSLPAVRTCPGASIAGRLYGAASVCNECYATGGFYRMPSVETQLARRFAFVRHSLKHNNGDEFVNVLTSMIEQATRAAEPIFRGHDSGDFFSAAYVDAWYRICEALPAVQFWFPTRSHLVASMLPALQRLASLPNVAIRPSAPRFDDPAPAVAGLSAGSTVIVPDGRTLPVLDGHKVCPATTGEPSCDAHGCRACWAGTAPVAYVVH
jgi:hypothetical protein